MQYRFVLWLVVAAAVVAWSPVEAQRGGGPARGGGNAAAPAPEPVGTVAKALVKKIKLEKPQNDTLKLLLKSFEAREKELNRLASMTSGSRGGTSVTPQLRTALAQLQAEYIHAARAVMKEDQTATFDANLEEYRKKAAERASASRGRGRGS